MAKCSRNLIHKNSGIRSSALLTSFYYLQVQHSGASSPHTASSMHKQNCRTTQSVAHLTFFACRSTKFNRKTSACILIAAFKCPNEWALSFHISIIHSVEFGQSARVLFYFSQFWFVQWFIWYNYICITAWLWFYLSHWVELRACAHRLIDRLSVNLISIIFSLCWSFFCVHRPLMCPFLFGRWFVREFNDSDSLCMWMCVCRL